MDSFSTWSFWYRIMDWLVGPGGDKRTVQLTMYRARYTKYNVSTSKISIYYDLFQTNMDPNCRDIGTCELHDCLYLYHNLRLLRPYHIRKKKRKQNHIHEQSTHMTEPSCQSPKATHAWQRSSGYAYKNLLSSHLHRHLHWCGSEKIKDFAGVLTAQKRTAIYHPHRSKLCA